MYRILVLSDNKQSSNNLCEALISEIKKIKKISTDYLIINKGIIHYLPNILIYLYLKIFYNYKKFKFNRFDLIISCGRITAPYNLIYKRMYNSKNIHILDPYIFRNCFTKIIIPEHDKLKTKELQNSLITIGTLVYKNKKKATKVKFNKNKKIITFLIGGSGKSSNLKINEVTNVLQKLKGIEKKYNFVSCFSRRTPATVKQYLINNKYNYYPKEQNNPYQYLIEKSDYFIITEDSVGMISDAISTGKPVFIKHLKKVKPKLRNFSNYLISSGFVKKFDGKIINYKYKPLNEARRVAIRIISEL